MADHHTDPTEAALGRLINGAVQRYHFQAIVTNRRTEGRCPADPDQSIVSALRADAEAFLAETSDDDTDDLFGKILDRLGIARNGTDDQSHQGQDGRG